MRPIGATVRRVDSPEKSAGGFQCGFCTPGVVMAAESILAAKAAPPDEEIRRGRSGNRCRCAEPGIPVPTFAQMKDSSLAGRGVRDELSRTGLWAVQRRNLYRITWRNAPVAHGGGFGDVSYLEPPGRLTVLTDSMELCGSRLREFATALGKSAQRDAVRDSEAVEAQR